MTQVLFNYDRRSPFEAAGVEPTQRGGLNPAFKPNTIVLSKRLFEYLGGKTRPRCFRPVNVRRLRTRVRVKR